jgi:anti-sigma B factor antagonist
MMKLNLSFRSYGDRAVVQVGGEVDLATCPQLQAALAELVDRGFHQLIVDLEQVSFLDCAGIGVLVEARRRVHRHHGSLKLVRPAPLVRRELEVTGRTAVFPIDSSHGMTLVTERAAPQGRHRDPHDPSVEPSRGCAPGRVIPSRSVT